MEPINSIKICCLSWVSLTNDIKHRYLWATIFLVKEVILKENVKLTRGVKRPFKTIRVLRSKHSKNVSWGHFNVNSPGNMFDSVNELIRDTFNIFLLSKGTFDSSFSDFSICGYRTIRKDRNKNCGWVLFYINEDIPSKMIESNALQRN